MNGNQKMTNFISNIYAVERRDERENIKKWDKIGNKMLLWHGTKPENVLGILQTGFRIAPACAETTGAMFGPGVYFTDLFNKSYNYTSGTQYQTFNPTSKRILKAPKKYVFLCEVALGNSNKLFQSKNVIDLPNSKLHSVMGIGKNGPDPTGNVYLPSGCVVPLGNKTTTPEHTLPRGEYWALNHNEYVVYDTTQVRIKYMVELRQNQNK